MVWVVVIGVVGKVNSGNTADIQMGMVQDRTLREGISAVNRVLTVIMGGNRGNSNV